MSREIKFRDYCFDTNKMRYFDLDHYDKNEHDCFGNIMQMHNVLSRKAGRPIYQGDLIQFSLMEGLGQKASVLMTQIVESIEFYYGYYTNVRLLGNIHEHKHLL